MSNWTTWFLNSIDQPVAKLITDTPPLTFNSNKGYLTDWSITGSAAGVGDPTDQLYNIEAAAVGYKMEFDETSDTAITVEDEDYLITDYISCEYLDVFSCSFDYKQGDLVYVIRVFVFDENKDFLDFMGFAPPTPMPAPKRITINNISITQQGAKYFRVTCERAYNNLMINQGSTVKNYEPYGYKIPISCGGTTTNVYIDEPLLANDTITYTDTKIKMPTKDGSNTFSVGTTNAPSEVSIQTNGVTQGFRDWFTAQMVINDD